MRNLIGGTLLSAALATAAGADTTILTVSNGVEGGIATTIIPHNGGLKTCEGIALANSALLISERNNSGVSATCLSDSDEVEAAFVCTDNRCRKIDLSPSSP